MVVLNRLQFTTLRGDYNNINDVVNNWLSNTECEIIKMNCSIYNNGLICCFILYREL